MNCGRKEKRKGGMGEGEGDILERKRGEEARDTLFRLSALPDPGPRPPKTRTITWILLISSTCDHCPLSIDPANNCDRYIHCGITDTD